MIKKIQLQPFSYLLTCKTLLYSCRVNFSCEQRDAQFHLRLSGVGKLGLKKYQIEGETSYFIEDEGYRFNSYFLNVSSDKVNESLSANEVESVTDLDPMSLFCHMLMENVDFQGRLYAGKKWRDFQLSGNEKVKHLSVQGRSILKGRRDGERILIDLTKLPVRLTLEPVKP